MTKQAPDELVWSQLDLDSQLQRELIYVDNIARIQ
jgi:hypothetical protein